MYIRTTHTRTLVHVFFTYSFTGQRHRTLLLRARVRIRTEVVTRVRPESALVRKFRKNHRPASALREFLGRSFLISAGVRAKTTGGQLNPPRRTPLALTRSIRIFSAAAARSRRRLEDRTRSGDGRTDGGTLGGCGADG